MKTIWIVDHYSSEPKYGGYTRQYDFAKELDRRGYRVVIISSSFSHFSHTYFSNQKITISKFCPNAYYVYLKTSSYEINSGMGRAKSMISFLLMVLSYEKIIAEKLGKPNVVTGCSVHPLSWVAAYRISQKYKARYCIEIRDLWPYALVACGDKSKYDPMVIFFGILEKWACKKASKIIYSMSQGDMYFKNKLGVPAEKLVCIGQPIDCDRYDKNTNNFEQLPSEIKNFVEGGFICTFSGYYMAYEGVYVMLEACKLLKLRKIPVKMVFVGSGKEKEGMKQYVKRHDLENHVLIWDRIPKETVPALQHSSNVCVAHLDEPGHPEVFKYGMSKIKVSEYLYSGAVVLFGFRNSQDPAISKGGAIQFEPFNSTDLANALESVVKMDESTRNEYGRKSRAYTRQCHSVNKLTDVLEKALFQ